MGRVQSLHTAWCHLEPRCPGQLYAAYSTGVWAPPFSTRSSGLKRQGLGFCTWHSAIKGIWTKNKERIKKIRLYFIIMILLLFPGYC